MKLKALSLKIFKDTKTKNQILTVVIIAVIMAAYFYNTGKNQNAIEDTNIKATVDFTIVIPKINVTEKIYEGKDEKTLNKGPAHYPGTAMPSDEKGNVVIAGHAAKTKAHNDPFVNLDQLQKGDSIYLTKDEKLYHYQITESKIVASTEMSVVDPTEKPTLTLITCIKPDYPKDKRLIVKAERVE